MSLINYTPRLIPQEALKSYSERFAQIDFTGLTTTNYPWTVVTGYVDQTGVPAGNNIGPVSWISVSALVYDTTVGAKAFEAQTDCFEILIVPVNSFGGTGWAGGAYSRFPAAQTEIFPSSAACASWLWGRNFRAQDDFNHYTAAPVNPYNQVKWVCEATRPACYWLVMARIGNTDAIASRDCSLYLGVQSGILIEAVSPKEAINPECTVPPFGPVMDATPVFNQFPFPMPQTSVSPRQFKTKAFSLGAEGDPPVITAANQSTYTIGGGPWHVSAHGYKENVAPALTWSLSRAPQTTDAATGIVAATLMPMKAHEGYTSLLTHSHMENAETTVVQAVNLDPAVDADLCEGDIVCVHP